MDLARVWIDWKIRDIFRFDVDIEILEPTPEKLQKGLLFWQWHFNFKPEGGYIGLQLVESKKKAIFSIWSASNGGNGCSLIEEHRKPVFRCLIDYPWKLGRKYRLVVKEGRRAIDGSWWVGEIYDYANHQTTTIGKISVPFSFGKLSAHNYYTCIEYGYFGADCENLPHIKARFSGHYAYNGREDGPAYLRAEKPKIEYPTKCENSKIILLEDASYILEAGNGVRRFS